MAAKVMSSYFATLGVSGPRWFAEIRGVIKAEQPVRPIDGYHRTGLRR